MFTIINTTTIIIIITISLCLLLLLLLLLLSLTLTQVPYYPYAKKDPQRWDINACSLYFAPIQRALYVQQYFFPDFNSPWFFFLFIFFSKDMYYPACREIHAVFFHGSLSLLFLLFSCFNGRRLEVLQPSSRLSVVVRLKEQRMLSPDNLEDGLDFCAIPTELCRFVLLRITRSWFLLDNGASLSRARYEL